MKERKWIRQTHRWLSITFTVLVIINIVLNVVPAPEVLAISVGIFTLLPLVFLMLTGLYLFALPYMARRQAEDR